MVQGSRARLRSLARSDESTVVTDRLPCSDVRLFRPNPLTASPGSFDSCGARAGRIRFCVRRARRLGRSLPDREPTKRRMRPCYDPTRGL